jgi:hypothetical protein
VNAPGRCCARFSASRPQPRPGGGARNEAPFRVQAPGREASPPPPLPHHTLPCLPSSPQPCPARAHPPAALPGSMIRHGGRRPRRPASVSLPCAVAMRRRTLAAGCMRLTSQEVGRPSIRQGGRREDGGRALQLRRGGWCTGRGRAALERKDPAGGVQRGRGGAGTT